jgi:hypothetical protein
MLYVFRRAAEHLTSETRLNPEGPGYQIVVRQNDVVHIEAFDDLPRLLAREHELLLAWRAQGWSDVHPPAKPTRDTWSGP